MTQRDDSLAGLARRVTALEERVALEAGLRAALDRDLATLQQGQQSAFMLLQALHVTQGEHTRKLDRLESTLALHAGGLAELREGQALIVQLVQRLIDRE